MKKLIKFTHTTLTKNNKIKLNKINFDTQRFYAKKESSQSEQVAVILSGCGYLDGTEITEAVSLMIHLSDQNINAQFFAPTKQQEETLDHIKKSVEKNEVRNILAEATRITRNPVLPLNRLKADTFSCLFVPGGFGVAKNLSNFANVEDMSEFTIDKEVAQVLKEFHDNKKPIGLICIAPVLAAKLFKGCSITLGDDTYKSKMEKLGANLLMAGPEDVVIDKANKIISTPGYMIQNAKPYQVYKGIGELVQSTLNFSGSNTVDAEGKASNPLVDSLLNNLDSKLQDKLKKKLNDKKGSSIKYNREGAADYKEGEEKKH